MFSIRLFLWCGALSLATAYADPVAITLSSEKSMNKNIDFYFEAVRTGDRDAVKGRAKEIANTFFKPLLKDDRETAKRLYQICVERFRSNEVQNLLQEEDLIVLLNAFSDRITDLKIQEDYERKEWVAALVVGLGGILVFEVGRSLKWLFIAFLDLVKKLIPDKEDVKKVEKIIQKLKDKAQPQEVNPFRKEGGFYRKAKQICRRTLRWLGVRSLWAGGLAVSSYFLYLESFEPWDHSEDITKKKVIPFLKKLIRLAEENNKS